MERPGEKVAMHASLRRADESSKEGKDNCGPFLGKQMLKSCF